MKSPIYRSTSDLNPFGRVFYRVVFAGGGFPMDASSMVRGVVLTIGGGVDLSAIALLRCTIFYFCSRVFGGAIVAHLIKFIFFMFIHRLIAKWSSFTS